MKQELEYIFYIILYVVILLLLFNPGYKRKKDIPSAEDVRKALINKKKEWRKRSEDRPGFCGWLYAGCLKKERLQRGRERIFLYHNRITMENIIESLYTIFFIILAVAGVIIIVFACILFYLVFHDDQIANMDDHIHSHLGTTQKRFDEKP
jgi:hypothetical protein